MTGSVQSARCPSALARQPLPDQGMSLLMEIGDGRTAKRLSISPTACSVQFRQIPDWRPVAQIEPSDGGAQPDTTGENGAPPRRSRPGPMENTATHSILNGRPLGVTVLLRERARARRPGADIRRPRHVPEASTSSGRRSFRGYCPSLAGSGDRARTPRAERSRLKPTQRDATLPRRRLPAHWPGAVIRLRSMRTRPIGQRGPVAQGASFAGADCRLSKDTD